MSRFDDVQEITGFIAADGTPAIAGARLVNFETGKFELRPGHHAWIEQVGAPAVASSKNSWVDIYGFASKAGNAVANLELSRNRAEATKQSLGLQLAMRGVSLNEKLKIDHGFGEDHPSYVAGEDDNTPYWRAAEILIFGKRPSIIRPKKKKEVDTTRFEIRVVGGGSAAIFAQGDFYFFQIVDAIRRKTAFFYYTGGGYGVSIPKIPGPGSVTKHGPPTTFTTSRSAELHQFNSEATLTQDAGYTIGEVSVGGALGLSIKKIKDSKGLIFTNPNPIVMSGGSGIQMPGLGSVTEGVLAKVSDDFPFNGY